MYVCMYVCVCDLMCVYIMYTHIAQGQTRYGSWP